MRPASLVLGTATLTVALACCTLSSVDEEGLHVGFDMVATPAAAPTFTTDLGYEVTVTRGYAAIASVEILPCDEGAQARAKGRDVLRWLGRSLAIREAAAHSTSSPTLLGVPAVLPLAPAEEVHADLGRLSPPPDRYCTTRIRLGPADGDAVMLPADVDMVGTTLLVEGTWTGPEGGEPVAFRWESTATPSFDHATRFELAEEGAHEVVEELGAPFATIFDGLDLATIDPAIGADRVAARVVEDLHVEL